MLLSEFIRHGTEELSHLYPSPEARGMVFMLLEERLGVKNYTHIIEPGYEIEPGKLPDLEDSIKRMASGEPVQYVLGFSEFCGRRFRVTPSVLIPRPETELLVAEAVNHLRGLDGPPRVLDMCTGSGCIAWSVLHEITDAEVVAVDISDDALAIASDQFPGEKSPVFMHKDVLTEDLGDSSFDVIVSNPPYVMDKEKEQMRLNVLGFEPHIALFVPDSDPLVFYRAVSRWAEKHLSCGGAGFVEINENLPCETAGVFISAGFSGVEVIRDLCGKPRIVKFYKI